ncbi:chloride channel protein [Aureicoccus marinus]|uniref:Chloride channel protein n=1 Tax=Aureicoccus marinus TaxID=754435 RepID=A0A2S7T996_9FLAO|nr:chloride channel protein [Aureicoccus marinus]PQJ16087.1 chloride channel protein [Aureicoccus marinus]
MPGSSHNRLSRFIRWRYKNVSDKGFVFLLSVLVGFLSGFIAVTLKNLTFLIQEALRPAIEGTQNWIYLGLPLIGLILVHLYVKFVHMEQLSQAVSSILFVLSKKGSKLSLKHCYTPLLTVPVTVGFGGSVGLLGSAIASGSALSSQVSRLLHLDVKKRSLLIACATAGAISSIFQSPIAAVIFALEVFSLDLTMLSLMPLLLASVSGVLTRYFFLGNELLFDFQLQGGFELKDTLYYIFLGLATGFGSIYFTKMYFAIQGLFARLKNPLYRLLIGGLAIGLLLYTIPPLYGEGFGLINNLLAGDALAALGKTPFDAYTDNAWVVIALLVGIIFFKAIAMTTTLAAGGSGGIIIPTLVVGSALGNTVAQILSVLGFGREVYSSHFTLIGMAGLISGVIHAPLTSIFLIAELTGGYELFVPLMITASISYLITRGTLDYTIYTKELKAQGALLTHDKDQNVLTLMKMDEVIERNFRALHPEMTLGEMLHSSVAKSNRNLFPVLDDEQKMVGVVLLDDIREMMFQTELYDKRHVKNMMHAPPEYIFYETDDMRAVMKKFQDSGAWNLPVIKDDKYDGFISKSKMLTAYRRKLIYYAR